MTAHLGPEAAAPFTDAERAQFAQSRGPETECVLRVPNDAGLPGIKHAGRAHDHRFAYRDASGGLLGYVLRWDARDGADKEIRPATFWRNGKGKGAWACRSWPNMRPLFGLDRLAARPRAIVLLLEGEKAAEAVERGPLAESFKWAERDVIGMTWPGGTNAIGHADFSGLGGRDVIILPDNDQPGEAAADVLVDVLRKVGVKRLRRWRPPAEAPEKWDIADAVPDSIAPETLVKGIFDAPEIPATEQRLVLELPEFLKRFEPPHYLIEGLLQHHYFYSLTGMTGAGKTAVALLVGALVSRRKGGQKLGPHDVEHGRVVYIAKENPTDIRMRLIGMTTKMNIDPASLDFLVIEQLETLDKDFPRIRREIEAFGEVALVIVDTSPAVFQGDNENDNTQMRDHAKRLRNLCDLPGRPCVLALCHPVKNAASQESLLPRGGGAFIAEVDGNFSLWAHDDKLCDLHWTGKFRGPDFERITFRLPTVITSQLVDKKGRSLPTVMAEIVTDAEAAEAAEKGVFQEDRLLVAMLNSPRGSLVEWASRCGWFVRGNLQKPNKELARRVMTRLMKDKLVAKDGREFVLTPKAGKAAAEKAAAQKKSSAA
jgi:hypothetical protein